MPVRSSSLAISLVLLLPACGSGGRNDDAGTGSFDAGLTADAASDGSIGSDAAIESDAPSGDDAGPGGCNIRVSNDHRTECNDDCDARLLLVSGAHYCTFQCTTDSECQAHGEELRCVAEIGSACVPTCTLDSDCPAGFYRCDPTEHFCDTYPAEG